MRALAILLLCLLCGAATAQYNRFPPGVFTGRGPLDASGGAAAVTWDGAHKSTNFTLSGGNLTATAGGTNLNGQNTRSTTSHTTGKYYVELSLTTVAVQADFAFGLVNSSQANDNSFIGDTTQHGYGYFISGSDVFNNANVHTVQSCAAGHVAQMAVDVGAALVWFNCDNGNWNNSGAASPATGVGGFDISVLTGPYFVGLEMEDNTDASTVNFGATALSFTAPSGFGNWHHADNDNDELWYRAAGFGN